MDWLEHQAWAYEQQTFLLIIKIAMERIISMIIIIATNDNGLCPQILQTLSLILKTVLQGRYYSHFANAKTGWETVQLHAKRQCVVQMEWNSDPWKQ